MPDGCGSRPDHEHAVGGHYGGFAPGVLKLDRRDAPLELRPGNFNRFPRFVGRHRTHGNHVLIADGRPRESQSHKRNETPGSHGLDGQNRFLRARDDALNPVDLELHHETGGVVNLHIRLHIQPRIVGVQDALGHMRRKPRDHAPLANHRAVRVHAPDLPAEPVYKNVGCGLVRHADRRAGLAC